MKKESCLLIIPYKIYPIVSGYSIKNDVLIRFLNGVYNLKLIVISDAIVSKEEDSYYSANSFVHKTFYIKKVPSIIRMILSIISFKCIRSSYYSLPKVHKYIRNNCSDVDICIFDLVWCANYVKDAPVQAIRVFDMTDAISKIYRENYNNARSFLKKFYYLNESKKLHKYEIISIRNSDVTFLLNNAEVEYFKEYGNVVLLSHGVSDSILNYSKYDAQYSNAVAFIGNMSYKPNIEAAIWYAQNVHIHLCSEYPFIIVGASPTKEILDLQIRYKNIIVTGYLDDPFVILKSAKVVVAPIRSGSGIQNKVLQSMALEKCVVLSTLAASPIVGGINRVNFIVADSVDEYIDAIRNIDVYNRNNKIGLAAKQIISSKYSWGNYTKVYFSEIHKMKKYGV